MHELTICAFPFSFSPYIAAPGRVLRSAIESSPPPCSLSMAMRGAKKWLVKLEIERGRNFIIGSKYFTSHKIYTHMHHSVFVLVEAPNGTQSVPALHITSVYG